MNKNEKVIEIQINKGKTDNNNIFPVYTFKYFKLLEEKKKKNLFRSNLWTELREGILNQAKNIANAIQQRDKQKTKKHCWTPAEGTPLLLATQVY